MFKLLSKSHGSSILKQLTKSSNRKLFKLLFWEFLAWLKIGIRGFEDRLINLNVTGRKVMDFKWYFWFLLRWLRICALNDSDFWMSNTFFEHTVFKWSVSLWLKIVTLWVLISHRGSKGLTHTVSISVFAISVS